MNSPKPWTGKRRLLQTPALLTLAQGLAPRIGNRLSPDVRGFIKAASPGR